MPQIPAGTELAQHLTNHLARKDRRIGARVDNQEASDGVFDNPCLETRPLWSCQHDPILLHSYLQRIASANPKPAAERRGKNDLAFRRNPSLHGKTSLPPTRFMCKEVTAGRPGNHVHDWHLLSPEVTICSGQHIRREFLLKPVAIRVNDSQCYQPLNRAADVLRALFAHALLNGFLLGQVLRRVPLLHIASLGASAVLSSSFGPTALVAVMTPAVCILSLVRCE